AAGGGGERARLGISRIAVSGGGGGNVLPAQDREPVAACGRSQSGTRAREWTRRGIERARLPPATSFCGGRVTARRFRVGLSAGGMAVETVAHGVLRGIGKTFETGTGSAVSAEWPA